MGPAQAESSPQQELLSVDADVVLVMFDDTTIIAMPARRSSKAQGKVGGNFVPDTVQGCAARVDQWYEYRGRAGYLDGVVVGMVLGVLALVVATILDLLVAPIIQCFFPGGCQCGSDPCGDDEDIPFIGYQSDSDTVEEGGHITSSVLN